MHVLSRKCVRLEAQMNVSGYRVELRGISCYNVDLARHIPGVRVTLAALMVIGGDCVTYTWKRKVVIGEYPPPEDYLCNGEVSI